MKEKSRPLRFRLFLLAATGLVPLALALLLAAAYLARERALGTQRMALELSRAIATAVDAELHSNLSLLETLSIGTQLQDLSVEQLHGEKFLQQARQIIQRQRWRTIVVADSSGDVVSRAVDGAARSASPVEPGSLLQVLRSHAPAIGRVARGPAGNDAFAIRVPIIKDQKLRYVLTAVVPTDRVLAVVARQELASEWIVGVFDQEGFRVARSRASSSPRYSPTLEALVKAGGNEGAGYTYTLEGVESHTGFSRVLSAQWVVAVGIPVHEANADFYRMLAAAAAGIAASLAVMAWLAWRMTRGISAPIDALKQAATALGAGQPVQLPPLGVEELDAVGTALRQASDERVQASERGTKVQAEREQLLARLEEALRDAEQANRNKDEFLALLGHELRNPLAPITNALHLMRLKGDAGTAAERAVIQRQLNYMTRLVDDLLDASRITSNRFVIHPHPLRPVAVLEQTVESIGPMLGSRAVHLHVDERARTLWVRADEARLVQIFNNVLGNAIKFTKSSGTVEVFVRERDDTLAFIFQDDGAGMSAAELQRAFDLFYQAADQSRGVNGGLGLGLAIVRSLVEMHGGSVRMQSQGKGLGTTVTVELPVVDAPAEEAEAAPSTLPFEATPIMVVDDNVDAADTLSTLLGISGFDVRVAYSPQAALQMLESFKPELAVLDIGLPGMDGYELARRLRANTPAFTGGLIALTGYGQQQDVLKARQAGFDAHLTKPVSPEALLQLVSKLLSGPPRH